MGEIAEKLLKMKTQVEQAQSKQDRLEGQRDTLMAELSTKHDVKTIASAEKKLAALTTSIDQEQKTLEDGLAKLQTDYTWEGENESGRVQNQD